MIKSLHHLYVPARAKEYDALVEFFTSLGLAKGESWDGHRSKGVKLEAPCAGVEIGAGKGFPDADVVVEVDVADAYFEQAKRRKYKVGAIESTDWGARIFTVNLPAGAGRVAIFSYEQNWPNRDRAMTGELDARGKRFGIVVSRWNSFITERLLAGAIDGLRRCGARMDDVEIVRVPGSFELPVAARMLAMSGRGVDAVIVLGCLIRGETTHYEHIATEVTRGIGQSAQETGVPHAYGLLTCENLEQAIDRAGVKSGNKGFEAALSAVEMVSMGAKLRGKPDAKRAASKKSRRQVLGLGRKRR